MRFSTALAASKPPLAAEAEHARALLQPEESQRPASAQAPWPADSPPDDLDQRVRQVGEWQLGDW